MSLNVNLGRISSMMLITCVFCRLAVSTLQRPLSMQNKTLPSIIQPISMCTDRINFDVTTCRLKYKRVYNPRSLQYVLQHH